MALSFRNKLALFLIVTLVTVQALTAGVVYLFTRNALIEQGKAQLAEASALFTRQLDVRAAQLAEGVQILSLDFALRQAIATQDTGTALSALRNHGRRIGATRMLLIGLDGELTVDDDGEQGAAPLAGAFPFPDLLETAAVEDIASSLVVLDGRVYWLVTVPILAPVPIAFVGAGIPVDDALLRDLQGLSALPKSIALIAEQGGGMWAIVARTAEAATDAGQLVSAGQVMADGVMLGERAGTERLVLRQPLSVPPGSRQVAAVLEFPLAEAFRPYRPIVAALAVLLIGGLLAALLGTLLIAQGVTRPMTVLAAVARRIAGGDYSPPPPLRQKDEIGALADALGTMANAIGEREDRIRHQASHDAVTGLPNRSAMDRLITADITGDAGAALFDRGALLLIGLERISEIVNTLGHDLGDRLMRAVADRLAGVLEEHCKVARVGDHAFALWQPGRDEAAARQTAESLRVIFDRPYLDGELAVDIDAAVGIALWPDHGDSASALLQHADVALYAAHHCSAKVRCYEPEADPHRPERLSLMGDLREALDADALNLFFQPKLHLPTGRIAGAEGLVRWTHPKRGFVPPDAFIPLAEETGTIRKLTAWALRTGVAQAADWARQGLDIRASINLSVRDLADPRLPDGIHALLDAAGIGPDRLVLEVTESAIMDDPDGAIAVLRHMAECGIDLSIDDFGVGQSSLAYLRLLPVKELKIDKSFILKLAGSPADQTIVRSVVELAHGLGCRVTAEGVEDADSLTILRDVGCDYAQGYHIARPMPVDKFGQFLGGSPWPAKAMETAA